MKDIDHWALDGHGLRLFLAVLEEGSVTAAADRLDLTQSAVSHSLQKLRRIVGDPLFVKSGRGIVATAHALSLAEKARRIVDGLEDFARKPNFRPEGARLQLTIAANDFQAEMLLPELFRRLSAVMQRVELRVTPSGSPGPDLLRDRACDLILSPMPPEGTDIQRRRLFEDRYACFYDQGGRSAPASPDEYLAARHVTVVHPDGESLDFDRRLEAAGVKRDILVRVQGFAGVPGFLRGTTMLATLPGLLKRTIMRDFAVVATPIKAGPGGDPSLLPMYMVWHRRDHLDPAHAFVRDMIVKVAQDTRYPSGTPGEGIVA